MQRTSTLATVLVLASCGAPSSLPPQDARDAPRPQAHPSFDDLPEGECGGFATRGLSDPLALLAGRLRVRAPGGTEESPRPHDIMAAPPAARMESRLFLEDDRSGARFVVFAVELFRSPTDDLVGAARAAAGEGYRVAPLEVAAPLRAAVAIPDELDLSDEAVDVAVAYTATADGLVQRVGFYVTPDAARDGGCRRLGLQLARTLVAGDRTIREEPGPRVLEGTLGLDLPAGHRLVVQEGPDFTVYRVYPVMPLGRGEGALGVYVGHHPSFGPPGDARRTPGQLLGQAMEWHDWLDEGLHVRQALVPLGGHAYVHIFMSADDRAVLDRLAEIAASLRDGVHASPLAACPGASRLPAVEADAEVLAIPALQALLTARTFSVYRRTWDRDRVETTEAFLTLSEHPRARDAFLHLAVHGTTAGKLYGLAGLYLSDRQTFDAVVCAARDTLDATVLVQGSCGTEERPVPALVEAPDGVRGQAHWSPRQWEIALGSAPADLRGGGLAWQILLGPPDRGTVRDYGWTLAGEGYTPPLSASDRRAEALPALAPAPGRPIRTAHTSYGGTCRTRRDGRVACWGTTPLSERRGAALLPDAVRWPADLAMDLGLGCVLDASGRRACFALLEPALAARAQACPSAPAPTEPVLRRFDDGPWRALDVAMNVCGIRPDGSLRCFASSSRSVPAWAQIEGAGIGASYAVPIEGEVQGVAEGYPLEAYAWTADGSIWQWERDAPPRRIGRVEGVVDVTAGNDGELVFARASDGRVYVRGAPRGRDGSIVWWSSSGDDEGPWVEVEALRGATITLGDHHGCARMPDRRVRCWGQPTGFVTGEPGAREHDRPPVDVPALRGASALVLGEWLTCGVMRGGRLRCIGVHLDSVTNSASSEEARGPVDVRPDRIAASIE